jgi:hypothetical protein
MPRARQTTRHSNELVIARQRCIANGVNDSRFAGIVSPDKVGITRLEIGLKLGGAFVELAEITQCKFL